MGEGATRQGIITGTGFPKVFYLAYTCIANISAAALTGYNGPWNAPASKSGWRFDPKMAIPVSQVWTSLNTFGNRSSRQEALPARADA